MSIRRIAELEIVTSVVTLTEVIKLGRGTAEERDAIVQVFNQDNRLLVVDLTKHLAEQAREVIWKYSFKKHKGDAVILPLLSTSISSIVSTSSTRSTTIC